MQFHAVQPRSLRAIGCDGEMLDHHSDVVDRHGTIIDRSYLAEIGHLRLLRQIDAVIAAGDQLRRRGDIDRSEEHTSEFQSLMSNTDDVFFHEKKNITLTDDTTH